MELGQPYYVCMVCAVLQRASRRSTSQLLNTPFLFNVFDFSFVHRNRQVLAWDFVPVARSSWATGCSLPSWSPRRIVAIAPTLYRQGRFLCESSLRPARKRCRATLPEWLGRCLGDFWKDKLQPIATAFCTDSTSLCGWIR